MKAPDGRAWFFRSFRCGLAAVLWSGCLLEPLAAANLVSAGAETEKKAEASTSYSNCGDDSLGSSELNNGKTMLDGSIALLNAGATVGGDHAQAGASVQAGLSGQVELGSNGVQASGEIGLEAQLNALAQFSAGDANFGGGAAAEAKIQALLKAQGTVGAYLDEKGLTIGVDAKAEAMVSAEVSIDLSLTLFGIQTTVTATAKGQAGASANASALVTIGFDGMIYFKLGAGATAGIGGGVTFDAAVSAEQLMKNLGLTDMDQLIEWCEKLAADPDAVASQLARDAARSAAADKAEAALDAAKDLAGSAWDLAKRVAGSCSGLPGGCSGGGLQSLFSTGTGGGGGGGGAGGVVGGGGSGTGYQRDSQFDRWSQ